MRSAAPFRLGEERLGAIAAGEGDGAQEAKGEPTVRLGEGRGGGLVTTRKCRAAALGQSIGNGQGTVPGRTRPAGATGTTRVA
jgi:hypothetical protein